jgi:hypothetical protein
MTKKLYIKIVFFLSITATVHPAFVLLEKDIHEHIPNYDSYYNSALTNDYQARQFLINTMIAKMNADSTIRTIYLKNYKKNIDNLINVITRGREQKNKEADFLFRRSPLSKYIITQSPTYRWANLDNMLQHRYVKPAKTRTDIESEYIEIDREDKTIKNYIADIATIRDFFKDKRGYSYTNRLNETIILTLYHLSNRRSGKKKRILAESIANYGSTIDKIGELFLFGYRNNKMFNKYKTEFIKRLVSLSKNHIRKTVNKKHKYDTEEHAKIANKLFMIMLNNALRVTAWKATIKNKVAKIYASVFTAMKNHKKYTAKIAKLDDQGGINEFNNKIAELRDKKRKTKNPFKKIGYDFDIAKYKKKIKDYNTYEKKIKKYNNQIQKFENYNLVPSILKQSFDKQKSER